jgi:hypothetical protein
MATSALELRVAVLEAEMARLKQQLESPAEPKKHWVTEIYGAFCRRPGFSGSDALGSQVS